MCFDFVSTVQLLLLVALEVRLQFISDFAFGVQGTLYTMHSNRVGGYAPDAVLQTAYESEL